MTSLTTDIKTHVIRLKDGGKQFISQKQEEAFWDAQAQGARGIKVDGEYVDFNMVGRLLTIERFYQEYPDERPEYARNVFEENYPEYAYGNQQIRKPTNRARELMIQGLRKAYKEMGKSEVEAEQCLAGFTSGWSRKQEYWSAIYRKFEGATDDRGRGWFEKAKQELEKMKQSV